MASDFLIKISNLAKFHGHKLIFKNINFCIAPGMSALLTGANGAGKSTLLRIIAGLSSPSAGEVEKKDTLSMAYIGHATFLYPGLTAEENLAFWAKANKINYKNKDIITLLERLDLPADEPAAAFSRGMAQRLNFGRALMLEPDFFLLDEPFTGMDLQSRRNMRRELAQKLAAGAAMLMVSHNLDEDSFLTSQVFALKNGALDFFKYSANRDFQTGGL